MHQNIMLVRGNTDSNLLLPAQTAEDINFKLSETSVTRVVVRC